MCDIKGKFHQASPCGSVHGCTEIAVSHEDALYSYQRSMTRPTQECLRILPHCALKFGDGSVAYTFTNGGV